MNMILHRFLLMIALLTYDPARAASGSPPLRDDVLSAIAARSEAMRSATISWTETCFAAKGAFIEAQMSAELGLPEATIPPEDVHYSRTLTFSFDGISSRLHVRGQYPQETGLIEIDNLDVFDGTHRRVYKRPTPKRDFPLGRIYPRKAPNRVLGMLDVEPPLQCYRLNHSHFQSLVDLTSFYVSDHHTQIDGCPCIELTDTIADSAAQSAIGRSYFFDPDSDFTLRRYCLKRNDTLRQQTTFRWNKMESGEWVLAGWEVDQFDDALRLTTHFFAEITSIARNPAIDPAEFSIEFPPGTYIDDLRERPGKAYLVRADGSRRMITDAERGRTYEQLLTTNSTGDGLDSSGGARPMPYWLMGSNVVGVGLIVAFVWRRHRAQR